MRGVTRGVLLISMLLLAACGGQVWQDHRGDDLHAADLEGKWTVINYWAEWCAPCREEIPELNALDGVSEDIRVLGIHFDAYQGDELRQLSDQMGIAFPVMGHDFAAAKGLALPQVLPTTYIIDPSGQLVHSLQGPQDEASLLALMQ